jgi:hypothetical protein
MRLRSHFLRNDKGCHSTTMVDYYALPQTGQKAWPGRAAANELPHDDKARTVQVATLEDLALLFSDCASIAEGIGRKELGGEFQ